jgi:hypothetical protein
LWTILPTFFTKIPIKCPRLKSRNAAQNTAKRYICYDGEMTTKVPGPLIWWLSGKAQGGLNKSLDVQCNRLLGGRVAGMRLTAAESMCCNQAQLAATVCVSMG